MEITSLGQQQVIFQSMTLVDTLVSDASRPPHIQRSLVTP